jgi:hypothetical protein
MRSWKHWTARQLTRAQLHAAGNIKSIEYDTRNLPDEAQLVADLQDALILYRAIRNAGGWTADDDIIREAEEEGVSTNLPEAKRYRLHKSIERRSGNAEKVKKAQGTTCKGCDKKLSDVYGPIADSLIHAHHLRPLADLELDEKVELNPHTDFAVLCPNCHAIHGSRRKRVACHLLDDRPICEQVLLRLYLCWQLGLQNAAPARVPIRNLKRDHLRPFADFLFSGLGRFQGVMAQWKASITREPPETEAELHQMLCWPSFFDLWTAPDCVLRTASATHLNPEAMEQTNRKRQ